MNNLKITFELEDYETGDKYSATSELPVFYDLGENNLMAMGRQFNCFLRQAGYIRHNDEMLMEDLTEDELEAVIDFLEEYRERNNSEPKFDEEDVDED